MAAALSASLICSLGSQPGDTLLSKVNQRIFEEFASDSDGLSSNGLVTDSLVSTSLSQEDIPKSAMPLKVDDDDISGASGWQVDSTIVTTVVATRIVEVGASLEVASTTSRASVLVDTSNKLPSTFSIMIDTGKPMFIAFFDVNLHLKRT